MPKYVRGLGKQISMSDEEWLEYLKKEASKLAIDDEIKDTLCIEKIIVNGPATIIFWKDCTKTIVKCMETDTPDIEKAILMAYFKHKTGFTKTRTQKILKKLVDDIQDTTENNKDPDHEQSLEEAFKNVSKELGKLTEGFKGLYKEGNKDDVK